MTRRPLRETGSWLSPDCGYLLVKYVRPPPGDKPDPATIDRGAGNFHKLAGIPDDRPGQGP